MNMLGNFKKCLLYIFLDGPSLFNAHRLTGCIFVPRMIPIIAHFVRDVTVCEVQGGFVCSENTKWGCGARNFTINAVIVIDVRQKKVTCRRFCPCSNIGP